MAPKIVPAPDYEDRVRTSFARQKAMATIGAELTLVTPGIIEIEMPYSAALTQQHGFLHAGVISTALDSACGYAAFSLIIMAAHVITAAWAGQNFFRTMRTLTMVPFYILWKLCLIPRLFRASHAQAAWVRTAR